MHGLAFIREDRVPTIEQFLKEAQLSDNENSGLTNFVFWKWLSMAIFVVALTMFWKNNNQPTVEKPENPGTLPSDPEKPNPRLTLKEQKKISRMLKIAAMHFMVGRLVDPQGTNALTLIMKFY